MPELSRWQQLTFQGRLTGNNDDAQPRHAIGWHQTWHHALLGVGAAELAVEDDKMPGS